ncbi:MAG: ImmA/IrrE family metallo-endopeptidase [Vulcanimicrobiota bacterium]
MAKEKVEALITPALLTWARETAGYTIEQASAKVGVKPERLRAFEAGELRPSFNQLTKAAHVFDRPIGLFYLEKPPIEDPGVTDFRTLPGVIQDYPPKLRFALREIRNRRRTALELYEELQEEPPDFLLGDIEIISSSPAEIPRVTGEIRTRLGLTLESQLKCRGQYEAVSLWTRALEDAGLLVFQIPEIDLDVFRGVCIAETPLPTIAVNTQDPPLGRLFSMAHELGHVLMRVSGLHAEATDNSRLPPEQREIEVYCNAFAAELLVPWSVLERDEEVNAHDDANRWPDEVIKSVANRFSVSRDVIVRRLLDHHRMTQAEFGRKVSQYRAQRREHRQNLAESEGGPRYAVRKVAYNGVAYSRLVFDALDSRTITLSSASGYLGAKVQHFSEMRQLLEKKGAWSV